MIHLETVSNTGGAITSDIGALSQLFVVVFAITLSLALTLMALA